MKRSQRLSTVLALAKRKEEDAAKAFTQQQQQVQNLQGSMGNLRGFLDTYQQRYLNSGANGFSVMQLAEFRAFLSKINGAIEQQETSLQRAESDLIDKRRQWEAAYRYRDAMERLQQQAKQQEERAVSKREQGESDELAANKAARLSGE